ncbi:hypothetical protein DMA11_21115 [Marinilabiliaceae bacterium JC017]|nr:hypothetical protein DMA11_21115 [Marinilabiliaceae bacterium JC017]
MIYDLIKTIGDALKGGLENGWLFGFLILMVGVVILFLKSNSEQVNKQQVKEDSKKMDAAKAKGFKLGCVISVFFWVVLILIIIVKM